MAARRAGEVVVVGSANIDTAVRVARIPSPGETVLAVGAVRSAGGKGANQAVAAARAGGAPTSFLGCVGDDADGALVRGLLSADGVRVDLVDVVAEPTGIALITVDDRAENTIVVVPGANAGLQLGAAQRQRVAGAAVVLAQLEVPAAAVVDAARSRAAGARFVLNAAPSTPLPDALWPLVDVLVVNEHEAADQARTRLDDVAAAADVLVQRVPTVLVTRGAAGVLVARRGAAPVTVASPVVRAVDTTAAGDTFCGVLAAALAAGVDDLEAVGLGCAAASLAVQRPGAQDSVPTHAEVRAWRAQVDRRAGG